MKDQPLLEKVGHHDFKEFSKKQLSEKGFYKNVYSISLVVTGFLFSAAVGYGASLLIFGREVAYLIQLVPALFLSFTLLIVIHELLHGLAYKLAGAKRVYFGAILSKFIFYAGSDQQEFNGIQYSFIALFPFLSISLAGLCCLVLLPEYFLFILTVLFIHTLFCGGDFAILNFIRKYNLKKLHTYDSREKKETYFYLKE